ncbi:3353_t:CDS:2 [Cetraspora pellucida]|uniref:3353_t:CDS:1 n=1 Tax=Cetraspora pellucida TaxID=1433469 RepID=A0ACA9KWV6_9GLOM|nr:3353_t:CDS:2 [Cetraspora pellucida]
MNLEEYVNYPEEKETNEILNNEEILALFTNLEPKKTKGAEEEENKSDREKDDSTEIHQITHHEALSAIEDIKKLQNSSFKQVDIKAFFGLAD